MYINSVPFNAQNMFLAKSVIFVRNVSIEMYFLHSDTGRLHW